MATSGRHEFVSTKNVDYQPPSLVYKRVQPVHKNTSNIQFGGETAQAFSCVLLRYEVPMTLKINSAPNFFCLYIDRQLTLALTAPEVREYTTTSRSFQTNDVSTFK